MRSVEGRGSARGTAAIDDAERLARELRERRKELALLHSLAALGADSTSPLDSLLQRIADLIPPAWQYPEDTCARIDVDGVAYVTTDFRETRWKQAATIVVRGETVGTVEVFYRHEKPPYDEGPFLAEERELLNSLAGHLGRFVERKRIDLDLKATNEKLTASAQQLRAYNQQLEASNVRMESMGRQLQAAFEQGSIGRALTLPDGRLDRVNRKLCEMLGYTQQELQGKSFEEITHPDDLEESRACVRCLLAGEQDDYRLEKRYLGRDGNVVWAEVSTTLVRNEVGSPAHFVTDVLDVTDRKRAAHALRESEERFRSYVELAPYAVFVADAEGKYLEVNPEAERMTGYPAEELLSMGIPDLLAPDSTEAGLAHFRRLFETGHSLGDVDIRTKDGDRRTCSVSAVRLTGDRYLAFSHDVTERKQAQRAIADANARLEAGNRQLREAEQELHRALAGQSKKTRELEKLLDAAQAVLAGEPFEVVARRIFDGARDLTGARSGYVALRSESGDENDLVFLESGGLPCSVDPSLPMPIRGLRAEAYATGDAVADNDFMRGRWAPLLPAEHVELRNVLFAPLIIGGETVGIIGLANKPSPFDEEDKRSTKALAQMAALALQRWRAERALRESEENYRLLAHNTLDVIWTMGLDLVFRYVNPAILQMTGHTPDEWIGSTLREHCDEASFLQMAKLVADAVAEGPAGRGVVFETTMLRKDGSPIAVEVHGSVVFDDDGRPVLLQGVTRDITERRALQARITQSDRLSSMGMLAAGVAHEINNPLAYVLYNVDSLAEDLPASFDAEPVMNAVAWSDIRERVEEAREGARRIRDIVRGLGTFARVEKDLRTPLDLTQVVEVAVAMARNEIKYRARLVKSFANLPKIHGNEGRLSQVFLNLLINAVHAIDEGGVENNEIRIETAREGRWAVVRVTDTGHGIEPEHRAKLFEPFFSTKQVGKGSGLGLAISRNIVESHGGTIEVESVPGEGTVFTIRLPIPGAPIAPEAKARDEHSDAGVRGRVLVIDDEPEIRATLVKMFRSHEVVCAGGGTEARQLLDADQEFDVILCDVMMPETTGVDLHHWLCQHHEALAERLVFMTGGAFTPRAQSYLDEVGSACIPKPFDVAKVRRMVDERIREARTAESRREG